MPYMPQMLIVESLTPPVNLEGKDQKLLILHTNKIKEKPLRKGSQLKIEAHLGKRSWKETERKKATYCHDKHG